MNNSLRSNYSPRGGRRGLFAIFCLGAFVIIAAVIWQWWENHKRESTYEAGSRLLMTINNLDSSDNSEEGLAQLEALSNNSSFYGALANLYSARINLAQEKYSKAINFYQKIAGNDSYPELARIQAGLTELNYRLFLEKISTDEAIVQVEKMITEVARYDQVTIDTFGPFLALVRASLLIAENKPVLAINSLEPALQLSNLDPSVAQITRAVYRYARALTPSNSEN